MLLATDVRAVDSRIGENEPEPVLDNDDTGNRTHNLTRLRKNEFDDPRILVGNLSKLDGFCRRCDGVEPHEAAFGLRHDLLREDQHVPASQRDAGCSDGIQRDRSQIVAVPDSRYARERG